ncbi:sigma factor-like helix-turn-helix DNA-binding protein [Streptomyces roseolus]|uniref:sigma factor-like helix-turn-helix DNA-binding protein n=1 Tax=Streptomyces roseolus TaxID=67358 RepID=UPI00379DCEF1
MDDGAGPDGEREGAVAEGLDAAVLGGFLAVLDRLGARERVAYLLHDVFGLPPGETARVMGGSPAEAARCARRARERLRGGGPGGEDGGPGARRALVEAFLAAARARDAVALAALLAPDAVAYSERGAVHGAPAVAAAAAALARPGALLRPALVEGAVGAVAHVDGRPVAAVSFAFRRDRIVGVEITTGTDGLRALGPVFPEA